MVSSNPEPAFSPEAEEIVEQVEEKVESESSDEPSEDASEPETDDIELPEQFRPISEQLEDEE